MIRAMTETEVRRWRAEVAALYDSRRLEDRIMAVLMDLDIGGYGEARASARVKARRIAEVVRRHR